MATKSLLAAFAAVGIATTGLCDVTSANVVGYQSGTPGAGYKMVTPSFVNIAGGEIAIDNLKMVGATDTFSNICKVGSDGKWDGPYYWYNDAWFGGQFYPGGWFDLYGAIPAGITLKEGEGVWLHNDEETATVQSAGQVANGVTMNIPQGYSMFGNGSPVTIPVDKFRVNGATDTFVNACKVTADGKWDGPYYWYNDAWFGGQFYPGGWFDLYGAVPAGITLEPGDVLWIHADEANVTAEIPDPLAKDEE